MLLRAIALLAWVLICRGLGAAQESILPGSNIETAIAEGLRERGKMQGLLLVDVASRFATAFATADNPQASGYVVRLYSPLSWIKQKASDAAKEYRPFTKADVTPDMLDPVLRVVVYPSTPTHVIAGATRLASSVQHVVIRDSSRGQVVQPLRKEPFSEDVQNALGASVEYTGTSAVFPLQQVEQLRDAKGEFFITVVGTNGDKDFKVKRKHFLALFGSSSPSYNYGVNQEPITPSSTSSVVANGSNAPGHDGSQHNAASPEGGESSRTIPAPADANAEPRSGGQVREGEVTNRTEASSTATAMLSKPETPTVLTGTKSSRGGCMGISYRGNPRIPHDGVQVSGVLADSPAAQVGIQPGDFITAINDHYVTTADQLQNELRHQVPGAEIVVRYRQDSTIYDMSLVLAACSTGL